MNKFKISTNCTPTYYVQVKRTKIYNNQNLFLKTVELT